MSFNFCACSYVSHLYALASFLLILIIPLILPSNPACNSCSCCFCFYTFSTFRIISRHSRLLLLILADITSVLFYCNLNVVSSFWQRMSRCNIFSERLYNRAKDLSQLKIDLNCTQGIYYLFLIYRKELFGRDISLWTI